MSVETVDRIAADLLVAGVKSGGALLVHSSLSFMGHVPGGPETVILGLLSALGPEGTLLLPALSYRHVNMDQPVFDVLRTPSNVGAIPEYFRTREGTVRSVHPTHSVCGVGAGVDAFLGEHHLDETPCGAHSPYRRLREAVGQVLFLGCGMRPNTSMHAVEEVAESPYLFGSMVSWWGILADGEEIVGRCRRHGFAGWSQRYDRVASVMQDGGMREGQVLEATVFVLDCEPMWERALEVMKRDPFFFVERST